MKSFDATRDGSPKESRHGGSSRKLSKFEELNVLQTLLTSPGTFLHKVQTELFKTTGTWTGCSTICRYTHPWGMSRQKMSSVLSLLDTFVFIYETGSDRRNFIRKFGYIGLERYSSCNLQSVRP